MVQRLGLLKRKLTQETNAELLREYKLYQEDEEERIDEAAKERLLRVLRDGRRQREKVSMAQKNLLKKKSEIDRRQRAMIRQLVAMKENHDRLLVMGSEPPLYRVLSHEGRRQLTSSQQANGYFFISGHAFISLLQDEQVGGVFSYVRGGERLRCAFCVREPEFDEGVRGFQAVMRDAEGRHAYGICSECEEIAYHDYEEDFLRKKGDSACEQIRGEMAKAIGAGESLLIAPFHVNDRGKRVYPRLFFRRSHRQNVNNPYVNLDGVSIYTYLSIRCFQEDRYYHAHVYPKVVADAEKSGTRLCEIHGHEGKVAAMGPTE